MSQGETDYHGLRARQCREMAERSRDPEVKRLHEELAELHDLFLRRAVNTTDVRQAHRA